MSGEFSGKSGKIISGIFGENRSFPRESAIILSCVTYHFWTNFVRKFSNLSKIVQNQKNSPEISGEFSKMTKISGNFPGKSGGKKVGKKWGKISISGRNELYFQQICETQKNVEKKAQIDPTLRKMVIFVKVDNFGEIRDKFPRKFPREFSRKFPRKFPRRFFVQKNVQNQKIRSI